LATPQPSKREPLAEVTDEDGAARFGHGNDEGADRRSSAGLGPQRRRRQMLHGGCVSVAPGRKFLPL
jgi:hypothetical protein